MKSEINIFDFLKFKSSKRSYGNAETLKGDIHKMPITLSTDSSKDFIVYLLVKSVQGNNNTNVTTLSDSAYADIQVVDNEIHCQRFDSEEPVIYDLNGKRLNEDSRLRLRELD